MALSALYMLRDAIAGRFCVRPFALLAASRLPSPLQPGGLFGRGHGTFMGLGCRGGVQREIFTQENKRFLKT